MGYTNLPAKPAYNATAPQRWDLWGDALDGSVRQLIRDVPLLQSDLTQVTTRVSKVETGLAATVAGLDTARADIRSMGSQVGAAVSQASTAAQNAAQAQTQAQTSASAANQSAMQVAGLSQTVQAAAADVEALKTGKADRASLSTVATTGRYADLIGAPAGGGGGGGPMTVDSLPPWTMIVSTSMTARPTSRTDLVVVFRTAVPPVPIMLPVDRWEPTFDTAPPDTKPLPAVCTFDGVDGAAWPSPWTLVRTPTGGTATIRGNTGQLVSGKAGNYSAGDFIATRYGDTISTNVESTFTFLLRSADPYPRLTIRSDRPDLDPDTAVSIEWSAVYVSIVVVSGGAYTPTSIAKTHTVGTAYKARVQATGPTVRFRTWPANTTEPATWDVTIGNAPTTPGYHGLTLGSGAPAGAQTVTFDDFTLTTS